MQISNWMIPSLNSQLCLNGTVLLLCGSNFVKTNKYESTFTISNLWSTIIDLKKVLILKQGSKHNVFVQLLLINQLCTFKKFDSYLEEDDCSMVEKEGSLGLLNKVKYLPQAFQNGNILLEIYYCVCFSRSYIGSS